MSTPLDRAFDRDHPSLYAPKWTHRGASDRRDIAGPIRGDDGFEDDEAPTDQGLVIERFRVPRSLEPTTVPEPWSEQHRRSVFGIWARLILAISAAAVGALFVIGKLPASGTPDRVAEAAPAAVPTRSVTVGAVVDQSGPPAPQLLVVAGAPRIADELIPLGMSLRDAGIGASVVITGLPPGASITTGRSLDTNSWRLAPGDLGDALVRPPRGFVGTVALVAELRRFDDVATDHKTLRLEWTGPATHQPNVPVSRQLDADEIASLIKRGEEFVANSDLAAARLMLQRAAEAQDPRAAFALAATYDPVVLAQLGVRGLASDAAMARAWYEKAKQFGSAEASRRLELLASSNR